MFERFRNRERSAATLSAHDIESVDYANSKARTNPVRTFTQSVPRLSDEEMEKIYRFSGLIRKGVNRRARDAIRKGFVVLPDVEDRDDRLQLNADAREWTRRVGYNGKAIKALREMFVFGDGFLELAYADKSASNAEPPKSAAPIAVYNIDPFAILPVKDPATDEIAVYLTGERVRQVSRQTVKKWFEGRAQLPRGVKAVHPSRIQHFQTISLRSHPDGLGISIIEAAYIAALAKLAGDQSAGDILEWYSKGFFTLNIDFATPEELTEARKQLDAAKNARKNYFVGSERSKFDIKSPQSPNIAQFYDAFYIEFAAALEIPTMVLLGVQKGTVTGSGTDLTEYYDDVLSFQELLLEAPMLEVMRRVLKRDDISLQWVPLFVDKQTEADIAFKRSQATSQLFGSRVLSRREAIRFMATGELPNPDNVPDGYDSKEAESEPDSGEAPPEGGADGPAGPDDSAKDGDQGLGRVLPLFDADPDEVARLRVLGQRVMDEGGAA